MRWTKKEIREQLADLGDYRAEVQSERDKLAEEEILELLGLPRPELIIREPIDPA